MVAAGNTLRPNLPLVFLGPSMNGIEARGLLTANYRPPVRRGDLPARFAGTVIIIDGDFHQSLSVSPKEILRLLDTGTTVVGAASMGALRATELSTFGMIGLGWVFEAYRTGVIVADDEVAVAYDPDTLASLTVPLVNIRKWLLDLATYGHIDVKTAKVLFKMAREIFYADRVERRLLGAWTDKLGQGRLDALLQASGGRLSNVKADDAKLDLVTCRVEQAAHAGDQAGGKVGND